jgi:mandelamide amidase
VAARTESALGRLADAGAELVEMRVVDGHELAAQYGFPLVFHEVADALPRYLATLPAPYCHLTLADLAAQVSSPDVKAILEAILAEPTGEAVYRDCLAGRGRLREAYAEAFERSQVAALVYPTVPLPAPPREDTDTTLHNGRQVNLFLTSTRNTGPGSLAGMPSISLPNRHTAAGLPIGLSLEGPSGDDRLLLAVAAAVNGAISEGQA